MPINDLSPQNSPLSDAQVAALNPVLSTLTPFQAAWLSGYISAASSQVGVASVATAEAPAASASLTILYGSQTGNAKGLAANIEAKAQAAGLTVRLLGMDEFKAKSIKDETHLIIVTSTQGEGEPPENAIDLHKFLFSKKAPKLDGLSFAVLGLGDSSYEKFCQTGIDFNEQLAKLGGKALAELAACDVDYEEQADLWSTQVIATLKEEMGAAVVSAAPVAGSPAATTASQYNKQNPFTASISVNQKITGRDSQKDIRHIEIDLEDSGLSYQPGDTLGLWFENDKELVSELVKLVGLSGDEEVEVAGNKLALSQALVENFELTQSYPSFVQAYNEVAGSEKLAALLQDKAELRNYCYGRQIIDVIIEAPAKLSAEQLVGALRKITPRLYSISSSQAEVDEEVHLTVAVVDYQQNDATRIGGASGFLQRLEEGGDVKVYMESNDHFRLPEDDSKPVIMVGPGTGIAPFRSFMQERDANDASGKNWLFFGAQTFTDDFLYQTEWQAHVKSGLLSRIDLAFSRDQAEKIYVQDRIRENAEELFAWLEQGAYFYICGDATRMAKDVHTALVDVISEQGNRSVEQAEEYLEELRKAKRYQKDVY